MAVIKSIIKPYRAKPYWFNDDYEDAPKEYYPIKAYLAEDVERERDDRLLEIRRVTGETEVAISKRYFAELNEANKRAMAAEKKLARYDFLYGTYEPLQTKYEKAEARVKELEAKLTTALKAIDELERGR